MIKEAASPPRAVVFDAEGQDDLDLTSADVLKGLVVELLRGGVAVYFADVHAPVLERVRRTGLLDVVGEGRVFPTVDLAVREAEAQPVTRPSPPSRGGGREQT